MQGWHRLDFAHASAVRAKLAERFGPATANRMLAALRGVLKASFKLGLMSADHMTRACSVDAVVSQKSIAPDFRPCVSPRSGWAIVRRP